MKTKQFAALAGLGIAIAPSILMGLPASASISGFQIHKDSKGAVYFTGAPNSELTVTLDGLTQTRNVTANACGLVIIRPSTTRPIPASFLIGTNTVTQASLPTQLLPKCNTTTGQLEEARTADFKTAEGAVVVVGQTPSASVQMSFAGGRARKVQVNACGFGKISNSTTSPFAANASFTPAGGSAVTYGSLPQQHPYICKKTETGANVLYAPQI